MLNASHILSQSAPPPANGWLVTLVFGVVLLFAVLTIVAYLILAERKVSAWIQDRIGPNRAGPAGLLQPVADVAKLLLKEDFVPARVDRRLFWLAPAWIIVPAFVALAVVPLGGPVRIGRLSIDLQIARPDVGVLFVVAVASVGVYGLVLGGWAANSKYSFLGGIRSAAQLLSYEVPLTLTLLSIILVSGTLRMEAILAEQTGPLWWGVLPRWNVFTQPFAFLLFVTCVLAETNRVPFDLPEAEQELVGGYHTEYSSMKFGLFFLAEYTSILTHTAVISVLFLGGWSFWGLSAGQTAWYWGLAKLLVLLGKMALLIFLFMHIRWTLPRLRFDQLMRLAWKGLVPASLALVLVNAVLISIQAKPAWFTAGNFAAFLLVMIGVGLMNGPVTGRQRALRHPSPS